MGIIRKLYSQGKAKAFNVSYHWMPGVFHLDSRLNEYVNGFFMSKQELALCQITGHTYDLDLKNLWGRKGEIFAQVSADTTIIPMTNIEPVQYIREIQKAVITDKDIKNYSNIPLWFEVNGETIKAEPYRP